MQKAAYRWAIAAGAAGGLTGTLANFLVLPAVRAQLGFGRLRIAYVGDRSIPADIEYWARALGITVRFINPFRKGETYV
jgi:long-subunit acyl-CoA synthetase (AMP-forming)